MPNTIAAHWRRQMPMAMPLTFADQLRFSDPRLLRERLKLPPWLLFPLLEDRPDQATWSPTQQERFVCAINVLVANGTYGNLVAIHSDMSHMMHGTQRFLPWHRVYLMQIEQALQSVHPDVVVPYWNWTTAAEQGIPPWLQAVTPTVPMPNGSSISVIRSPGTGADLATIASNIPTIMGYGDFVDFWQNLEAVHGSVHVWVGGRCRRSRQRRPTRSSGCTTPISTEPGRRGRRPIRVSIPISRAPVCLA